VAVGLRNLFMASLIVFTGVTSAAADALFCDPFAQAVGSLSADDAHGESVTPAGGQDPFMVSDSKHDFTDQTSTVYMGLLLN